jgi:hypothetical protein
MIRQLGKKWLFRIFQILEKVFLEIKFEVGVIGGRVEIGCEFDAPANVDFQVGNEFGIVSRDFIAFLV